jgi:hypothetical protein
MDNTFTNEKLAKLKQLLTDYSFPERIHEGTLQEIDKLLTWAIQTFISQGASRDEVSSYLGDPFVEIGEGAGLSDWLYPCESPDEQRPSTDVDGSWYYDLCFKDHSLVSITKRKWRFTK